MLYLNDSQLVGRGTERYCYRHPHDPSLCVKVTHNLKNNKQQNAKDYDYFKKLEQRRIDWSHLPHCHGWVTTDKGEGLVFDLLQDDNRQPLKSLSQLLKSGGLDLETLEPSLQDLHDYLLRNRIFTSDLRESNIVCDSNGPRPPHLYIIDGIGDRDFIKLAANCPPLGRVKVNRQWAKFMKRMDKRK